MSTQRKITVFSTKGKQKAHIDTDVTTWGELKSLISDEGYDIDSLNAIENVNRTTLQHKDAKLPEGEFTVFLAPKKTKSGGKKAVADMSFKELRAELTDADKSAISEMFGKNYTRCSTDNLREYLESKSVTSTESAPEAVVEETAEVQEVTEDVEIPRTPLDKANQVKSLLNEICDETDNDDICERIEDMVDSCDGLIEDLTDLASPEVAAAKKAEEEELENLENEADDIFAGL